MRKTKALKKIIALFLIATVFSTTSIADNIVFAAQKSYKEIYVNNETELPSIMIKNGTMYYGPDEYMGISAGGGITVTVANFDAEFDSAYERACNYMKNMGYPPFAQYIDKYFLSEDGIFIPSSTFDDSYTYDSTTNTYSKISNDTITADLYIYNTLTTGAYDYCMNMLGLSEPTSYDETEGRIDIINPLDLSDSDAENIAKLRELSDRNDNYNYSDLDGLTPGVDRFGEPCYIQIEDGYYNYYSNIPESVVETLLTTYDGMFTSEFPLSLEYCEIDPDGIYTYNDYGIRYGNLINIANEYTYDGIQEATNLTQFCIEKGLIDSDEVIYYCNQFFEQTKNYWYEYTPEAAARIVSNYESSPLQIIEDRENNKKITEKMYIAYPDNYGYNYLSYDMFFGYEENDASIKIKDIYSTATNSEDIKYSIELINGEAFIIRTHYNQTFGTVIKPKDEIKQEMRDEIAGNSYLTYTLIGEYIEKKLYDYGDINSASRSFITLPAFVRSETTTGYNATTTYHFLEDYCVKRKIKDEYYQCFQNETIDGLKEAGYTVTNTLGNDAPSVVLGIRDLDELIESGRFQNEEKYAINPYDGFFVDAYLIPYDDMFFVDNTNVEDNYTSSQDVEAGDILNPNELMFNSYDDYYDNEHIYTFYSESDGRGKKNASRTYSFYRRESYGNEPEDYYRLLPERKLLKGWVNDYDYLNIPPEEYIDWEYPYIEVIRNNNSDEELANIPVEKFTMEPYEIIVNETGINGWEGKCIYSAVKYIAAFDTDATHHYYVEANVGFQKGAYDDVYDPNNDYFTGMDIKIYEKHETDEKYYESLSVAPYVFDYIGNGVCGQDASMVLESERGSDKESPVAYNVYNYDMTENRIKAATELDTYKTSDSKDILGYVNTWTYQATGGFNYGWTYKNIANEEIYGLTNDEIRAIRLPKKVDNEEVEKYLVTGRKTTGLINNAFTEECFNTLGKKPTAISQILPYYKEMIAIWEAQDPSYLYPTDDNELLEEIKYYYGVPDELTGVEVIVNPKTLTIIDEKHKVSKKVIKRKGTPVLAEDEVIDFDRTFEGFYTDPEFTNKYDDAFCLNDDITLYAKWTSEQTFDVETKSTDAELAAPTIIEENTQIKDRLNLSDDVEPYTDINSAWKLKVDTENVSDDTAKEIFKDIKDVDMLHSFNIDLSLDISDSFNRSRHQEVVTELSQPITMMFDVSDIVPDDYTDNIIVYREHEGEVEPIPTRYDAETGTVVIQTGKFSTYMIGGTPRPVLPPPGPFPPYPLGPIPEPEPTPTSKPEEPTEPTAYINTYATTESGSKVVSTNYTFNIVDTIKYGNLNATEGSKYKWVATVVDSITGNELKDLNGNIYTGNTEFIYKTNGEESVTIPISTIGIPAGHKIVVYEKLYDMNENLIASHCDINDENQTISIMNYTQVQTGINRIF